ncbi:MAG: ATP-binding protein [Pseudomonadota bacterium]|nr:ATP-binding protein [Pseudomonadota bacterium]
MMKQISVLQRVWIVSIVALILLLGINAVQSYRAIEELVDNEQRTSTTKSILRAIKDVFSSVQDAELGLRGFLITGKADHLRPYFTSLENIQEHISQLRSFNSELPEQRSRVDELEEAILERLDQMTEHINQHSKNSELDWLSSSNMLASHESLSSIRDLVTSMEEAEYQLLEVQSRQARVSRKTVMQTIVVANGLGLLLIAFIAVLLYRGIGRQQMEAMQLEAMVEQRTRELQLYSDELKRSNRELQDFAFVASHDLQEPLRKIRTFGDRLKSRYAEQLGDGADYIIRMQSAAVRMSNLIDDLLTFSRVTTRAKPFVDVKLEEVLDEVLDNLSVRIEETRALIEREPLPVVKGDASQMKQLLQNILSNALKFIPPGINPHIQIRCEQTQSRYCLQIMDNGIGFDEQYLEKIFTPFQRLHGKDQYQGTGIGLAICRRIVERHGGEIHARSEPGAGATFILDIPFNPPVQVVTENAAL